MAAVAPSQQKRDNGRAWEHRSQQSEDRPPNFTMPKPYSAHSASNSPISPEEFLTPNSSHFPPDPESSFSYIKGTKERKDSQPGILADRSGYSRDYQPDSRDHELGKSVDQGYDTLPSKLQPSTDRDRVGGRASSAAAGTSRSGKRSHREQDRERENASNWVHREKLIALEIQDHVDRGETVPQALLDARAATHGRYSSAGQRDYESHDSFLGRSAYDSRQGYQEQAPNTSGLEDDDDEAFIPEDPRTPEEIAEEARGTDQSQYMYHSPNLRSSSSRIPVSKGSPYPVPQEHLERSTLLPRKRSASIGLDGEGPSIYPRTRSRSQSNGSQAMFDDTEPMPDLPPSPGRQRQTGKTPPRKISSNTSGANAGQNKSRSTSSGQGADARPRTANRPEEPAPWLADMYKPDPHLPQDQQIIPTHAKRLMQAQQEREDPTHHDSSQRLKGGQVSSSLDKVGKKPPSLPLKDDINTTSAVENSGEKLFTFDLPPPSIQNGEPKSPASEHGGYRTMPKVNSPTTATQGTRMPQPIYFQEPPEEEQATTKKACACCIVM